MTKQILFFFLGGAFFGDARCAGVRPMDTIFESLRGSDADDESSGHDSSEDGDGYVIVGGAVSRRKVSTHKLVHQHARERSSSAAGPEDSNQFDLLNGEPADLPAHVVVDVLEQDSIVAVTEDKKVAVQQSSLDDIFEPREGFSYVAILPPSVALCNQLGICCAWACRACCEVMRCERIACQQRCNCDMHLVRVLIFGEPVKPAPLML